MSSGETISLPVDEATEDLRYRLGTAIEFDRELDFHIHNGLIRLLVNSVRRVRDVQPTHLDVTFPTPNEFQIVSLHIPDDNSPATAKMSATDS